MPAKGWGLDQSTGAFALRLPEPVCTMPFSPAALRLRLVPLLAMMLAGLIACGGGSDSASGTAAVAVDEGAASSSASAKSVAAALTADSAVSADALAIASNAVAVGAARALTDSASVVVAGVPEVPTSAAALPVDATGRSFYVDSNTGNDTADGRSAAAGPNGGGPWRTLGRLMTSGLAPGDRVVLACGSNWRETLRLPVSGTAAHPITVGAPSGGCAARPTIDGSLPIAPSGWTLHSGNIYKARLNSAPLQLYAAAGFFTEAHHPNRGYLAADPTSLYAAIAGDSPVVTVNGQTASNQLTTGADLALPTGVALAAGMRMRIRTGSWLLENATVGTVKGNTLSFAPATSYPLRAGWGYLLLGQLWMLDSPGEWAWDAATQQLYAWMPDSSPPSAPVSASVLASGIDVNARGYISFDGVGVRRVGTAILMRGSQGVALRNCVIEDTEDIGADAAFSSNAVFEANGFARIGHDAISGMDDGTAPASGMIVRNNLIRDSGVIVRNEQVLSLPHVVHAAIRSGRNATISGNTIIDTGYVGIRHMAGSEVEDNFISGSCTVLDDCGAIVIWKDQGSTIRRNTIVHSRGALAGKPAAERFTQAQGIYLDEQANGMLVEDNTVVDADNGIQIHRSSNNIVRGNRFYGNRVSQIWMQDDFDPATSGSMVTGNTISGNQMAATSPGALDILLQTSGKSTATFGTFDGNVVLDRGAAVVVSDQTAKGIQALSLAQWQQSRGAGTALAVGASVSNSIDSSYAAYAVSGSNLISNAAMTQNAAGWSSWNQTAPLGQLQRMSCAVGTCLRYLAGASPGLVSSPNFSVKQGQWYRLSVDLAADQDGQSLLVVARRGGGGNNGYESISDRDLSVTAGTNWARYSMIFQATATVIAGNAATGDNGARIDIQGLVPGRSVGLANMALVPIQPSAMSQISSLLVNSGATALVLACPSSGIQAGACASFRNLANDQPVSWPLSLAAHTSMVVYAQDPALIDSDGDGIADSQDRCPNTAAGVAVNSSGCGLNQR